MLHFVNVSFSFGERHILRDVSFQLGGGEFAVLLGENGAGKSTLLRLCNGLLKPDSGIVTVCGMDTQTHRTSEIAHKVGFLFQNPDRQICKSTAYDEVRFSLDVLSLPDADERAQRVLAEFGLSAHAEPFSMSRGERQRLALASVLAVEPQLLLLDEPTVGLDYTEATRLMDSVRRQQKNGASVLMITHDLDLANVYADKQMLLQNGVIYEESAMAADADNAEF